MVTWLRHLLTKNGASVDILSQFDGHSSCFGCKAKWKGQEPYAQGAVHSVLCVCSTLVEQWTHLRENFVKRTAYRYHSGPQGDSFEELETTDEPVFTGKYLSHVDNMLLDLEPEDSQIHLLPASALS